MKLGLTSGSAAAIAAAAGPGLAAELTQANPQGINHGDVIVSSAHDLTNIKKIYHGPLLPWYSKRSGKPPEDVSIFF